VEKVGQAVEEITVESEQPVAESEEILPELSSQHPVTTIATPSFPSILQGKVIDIEKFKLTKAMKQKFQCLRHLPEYSEIQFIEIDVKPLVDKDIYTKFAEELSKRQYKRKEKQRVENMEKRLWEEKRLEEEAEIQSRLQFYHDLETRELHLLDEIHHRSPSLAVAAAAAASNLLPNDEITVESTALLPKTVERNDIIYDDVSTEIITPKIPTRILAVARPQTQSHFPTLSSSVVTNQQPPPSQHGNPQKVVIGAWGMPVKPVLKSSTSTSSVTSKSKPGEAEEDDNDEISGGSKSTDSKSNKQKNKNTTKVSLFATTSTRSYK